MNTQNQAKNNDFFMIDTVAIKVKHPDFKVQNPQLFTPSLFIKETILVPSQIPAAYGKQRFKKYTQNPSASDRQNSVYKPNLTAYERFEWQDKPTYDLHIEFSVPKSIFGNSVKEPGEEHFGMVIRLLKQNLFLMGIEISEEKLKNAVVVKVHFAKNIPLAYPLTAYDAIAALYKADMGRGKDINIREFRNGGFALYFYATSYNVIFYDKLRDIDTPQNRAIDKDKLKSERQLIKNQPLQQEILRFENRLTKQTKVNSFLSEILGRKIESVTFEEVFKKEICQKALLKSWSEITDIPANQLAFKVENSPEETFDEMIKSLNSGNKTKINSLKKTLASFGLYTLIKSKGVRWTRDRIEKNWTPRSWGRLSEDIIKCATSLEKIPDLNAVGNIKTALDKFERYDWKKEM